MGVAESGDIVKTTAKQTMHVISNTHWDREWVIPFEGYRTKLVDQVDDLLRIMETDPKFKHYQMDGQSICMEDYLAVRPENRDRVRSLVHAGRLMIGPWFTLPDMPLLSGEAVVRNLLMGIQLADELGGAMLEGYTACSNGQISQLPQIYAGFGITSAVLYKGLWPERAPREFLWRSPDGTDILVLHLYPRYGRTDFYCLLYHEVICNVIHDTKAGNWIRKPEEGGLPFRIDGQRFYPPCLYECVDERDGFYLEHLAPYLRKLRDLAARDAATSQLIVFHGMDHTPPFSATPRLIAAANQCFDDLAVVDSSLPAALNALRREIDVKSLKVHEGELRDGRRNKDDRGAYFATLSTRMDVKIANREAEHALIDRAEPLCAWAWLEGAAYPDALMGRAWKLLLANQAHDSIDACNANKTNRDIMTRHADCLALCEALAKKALGYLMRRAHQRNDKGAKIEPYVMIFNPSLHPNGGLCEMMVDMPDGESGDDIMLVSESGEAIAPQVRPQGTSDAITEGSIARPMCCTRYHVLFEVDNVPAMGRLNLRVIRGRALKKPPALSPEANVMENNHLRAEILEDGRLNVLCKETGREYKGIHYFVDRGDFGDPWLCTLAPEPPITSIGVPARVECIENGPVRAAYRVTTVLDVPASCRSADSRPEPVKLTITCEISLSRCAKHLDVKAAIDNPARDHKLVVCFPTGLTSNASYAGSQYDVMERPSALPDTSGWIEPVTGYPNYGFAGLSDGRDGFSLLNIGLPEYFVEGDGCNLLTLTLLRAVALKIQWPEGHDAVQDGHCLGRLTCHYAIYPHAGGWEDAGLLSAYRKFASPPICTQYFGRPALGNGKSLVCLERDTLEVSCIKRAEDKGGLIVRLWNPLDREQEGVLRIGRPFGEVEQVNLNEERTNSGAFLERRGKDAVALRVGKKKIVTLRISDVRRG